MNNKFYKFLIDNTPVGYSYRKILCDENGAAYDYEIVEVNRAYEAMTGHKAADIIGRTGVALGMDVSREPFDWLDFYGRIALEQGSATVDYYSRPLQRYLRLNVHSPEKYYFATFYTDITNEVLELKELEKFFSVSLDLLAITDTGGRIVRVNRQWETVFGYTTEELLDMNLEDLILKEDLEKTRAARASLAQGKLLLNYTNRLRCKDGTFRYIDWRSYPSGELVYSSARDITDLIEEKISIIRYAEFPAKLLNVELEKIDFHEILNILLDISKARLVLLNLIQDEGRCLKIVDMAASNEVFKIMEEIHGESNIGRTWTKMPGYGEIKDSGPIIHFSSFGEYADQCRMTGRQRDFEQKLKIGEVIVAKIFRSGRMVGDFTLMMPEGARVRHDELTQAIIRQFSMIISRKFTEQMLKKSEERFKTMFEEAPLGIGLFELESGRARQINRKFAEIVGRSREEMMQMDWQSITHPDDMEANDAKRGMMFAGTIDGFNLNKRYIKPDGTIVWVNLTIVPLKDEDDDTPLELCMIEDITERKNREEEIVYLNYHDVLTGLYNRTFLDEEKKRLNVERQLPLSVIMGDINGLKLVNDAFGHTEGDKLLVEIARILEHCCRSEDIVARTGGDEFCILLPRTSAETASEICRRITAMCLEYRHSNSEDAFYPGIALGNATKISPGQSIERIINEAEDSMYKRKLLERKSIHSSIIASIRTAMFEKSYETEQHAERMVALSNAIGRILRLSDQQLNDLHLLATLHDLGKVSIDDHILSKRGALTDEEWLEMRKHPEIGYRIANASVELSSIAEYILCHHERWDGKGYPQGLSGESIPLLSRIISVVDAFDAMTEDRPYRKAMSREAAIGEIVKNAGSQFDPHIAELFTAHVALNAESLIPNK